MTGLSRFLDALPRWVRWTLFLPVGIGCSLIAQGVVHVVFDNMAGPTYRTAPGVTESAVAAFVGGATLTVFPAVLSPRPWAVEVIMFAVGFVWRVAPAAYLILTTPYLRPRAPLVAIVIAAGAIGGGLGLLLIRHLQRVRGRSAHEQAAE